MKRTRIPFATLAFLMFVAFSFESTPSDPATPDPLQMTPPQDEAASQQDIAHFFVAGAGGGEQRFHTFRAGDFHGLGTLGGSFGTPGDPAADGMPRQLSMLDPGADPEAARRFLHQMPYGLTIARAAARHHVDALLLAAIVATESGFSARAVSPQGARGLMQVIPEVAQDYGIEGDLLDPAVNMEVGSRFVSGLLKDYKGDVQRALAAYNAGPGVVDRYRGVPPYPETRGYVRDVLAQYQEYQRKAGLTGSR